MGTLLAILIFILIGGFGYVLMNRIDRFLKQIEEQPKPSFKEDLARQEAAQEKASRGSERPPAA